MLAPKNRLIFWTAVMIPITAAGVVSAAGAALAAGAGLWLVLIAIVDALRVHQRLRTIDVVLPEVIRTSTHSPARMRVDIVNATEQAAEVTLGLPLPDSIEPDPELLRTALPAGTRHSHVYWTCTPQERGRFAVAQCHCEVLSPLGFWGARKAVAVDTQFRVYPSLLGERRQFASMFLNRGGLGIHTQRMIGQGRDFEKLRAYQPGDDYGDIHWKASAKRARLVTKLFQVERTQEIYVAVDASRLSGRDIDGEHALERSIIAALVLGLVTQKQGDLFGLLTFSSGVSRFIRARSGRQHYDICRDTLYTLKPDLSTPDFNELATFIRLNIRRRSLIAIVTHLDDPLLAEQFLKSMKLVCPQHMIIVLMVRQKGIEPVFSHPNVEAVDDLYERLSGHLRWHDLRELERSLHHQGMRLILTENERLSANLVVEYLAVIAKQAL